MASSRFWTIVLAGGDGTRLRSLTRALHGGGVPKQFAFIEKDRSLLQTTLSRSARWSAPEMTVVIVGQEQERFARPQLEAFPGVRLVIQPKNAGTGPGVLLPVLQVLDWDPSALVAVLPSDHYVRDTEALVESVTGAEAAARRDASLMLLGAVPDRPETQYGWIVRASDSDRVARFHEKPELKMAERLFDAGGLWNTFIMVGPAARLWELGQRHLPTQTKLLEEWARTAPSERAERLRSLYQRMKPADFSRDVLERADSLRLFPLRPCGWSDWGTPERVLRSLLHTPEYAHLLERLKGAGVESYPGAEATT